MFELGLLLIPFDNLVIAPSSGWATLSPIIFFIYNLLNMKYIPKVLYRENKLIIFLLFISAYQCILMVFNGLNLTAFLDNFLSLILGISFYCSLLIRYNICKKDINKDAALLYKSYVLGFIYGLIRLVAMKWVHPLLSVFILLEKRSYDRLAFSFTEPSFISMHVFGVMFLITYLISDEKLRRKFLKLGFLYLLVAIVTNSSSRSIIDLVVFLIIYMARAIIRNKKNIFRNLIIIVTSFTIISWISSISTRVSSIVQKGIYYDASLAARWFRVNASIKGYLVEPYRILFGSGLGNMHISFNEGYAEAYQEYNNVYLTEVNELRNATSISTLFSLPIKLISETGLIVTIIIVTYFIQNAIVRKIDIFVLIMTFGLYVQFDSYAFYSLWILLYICKYYDKRMHGISYFDSMVRVSKVN